MNIAKRMQVLIEILHRDGVNGIKFPDIAPECDDEWSEDYAIVQNAYCPDLFMMDSGASHYFDESRLEYDFRELVQNQFGGDPTVTVQFHNLRHGSNEIEVYRETKSPNAAHEAPSEEME